MKNLRMGVIGLGKLGYLHTTNIAKNINNCILNAVCDMNDEALNKAKLELGVTNLYKDFEEMITSGTIDAVAIISPSAFHFEHIKIAIKHNMPIFCEKPLATKLEEIYAVRELITSSNYTKPFQLAFMRRFDPSYARAKEMINNGVIGKPFMIRCYGLDPIKYVKTAVPFAKHSGGIFLDMMIHDIDLARWYMEDEVKTIYAAGDCYVEEGFKEYGDVDNGTAMMTFDNGGMALFFTSRTCHHGYNIETEIVGTEGIIRIGNNPNKDEVVVYTENGATAEYKDYFMTRFTDAYRNEISEFVKCVLEDKPTTVGVLDGIRSTEIAYGCTESMREDKLIRLEKN